MLLALRAIVDYGVTASMDAEITAAARDQQDELECYQVKFGLRQPM